GTDVLRALALGASGVLIGRPVMWGLAVGGEAGARRVLDLLAAEFRDTLGLSGCDSVAAAAQLHAVHDTQPHGPRLAESPDAPDAPVKARQGPSRPVEA